MIGRLTGVLLEKQPPQLMLDVNGIGYLVDASMNTFYQLPECGECVTLHIHSVIREDAHLLYGFIQTEERALFRQLVKVNGVGPKLALTILSGMDPHRLIECIQSEEVNRLVKLPGIGKKTAERLIIEMKDKLSSIAVLPTNNQSEPFTIVAAQSAFEEAVSALIALGFKPTEATKTITNIHKDGMTSEELIKMALKG